MVNSQTLVITDGITPMKMLIIPDNNSPRGRKILEFDSSEISPETNLETP